MDVAHDTTFTYLSLSNKELEIIDLIIKKAKINKIKIENFELQLIGNVIDILEDTEIWSDFQVKKGVYEGGFQIWECTWDMIEFLKNHDLMNQNIFDLGCGQGLLGLYSLKKGCSKVYFQDYNIEVLKYCTIPFLLINGISIEQLKSNIIFIYGSWKNISLPESSIDYIISSEILYEVEFYDELLGLLEKHSKCRNILIASKLMYFGNTGSIMEFGQFCQKKHGSNIKLERVADYSTKTSSKRTILKVLFQ